MSGVLEGILLSVACFALFVSAASLAIMVGMDAVDNISERMERRKAEGVKR